MEQDQERPNPSIQTALKEWRTAEQVAAVARRGRIAAQAAAAAASHAAVAAVSTATAARAALRAATRAEKSAARTAESARAAALASEAELSDATNDERLSDIDEIAAAGRYRDASGRGGWGSDSNA